MPEGAVFCKNSNVSRLASVATPSHPRTASAGPPLGLPLPSAWLETLHSWWPQQLGAPGGVALGQALLGSGHSGPGRTEPASWARKALFSLRSQLGSRARGAGAALYLVTVACAPATALRSRIRRANFQAHSEFGLPEVSRVFGQGPSWCMRWSRHPGPHARRAVCQARANGAAALQPCAGSH